MNSVTKIISGGQTGADRGGLLAAMDLGLQHGGWCPQGRIAEDGVIPAKFNLVETASRAYMPRTAANVSHSDGTVIFQFGNTMTPGSRLTRNCANIRSKPWLLVRLDHFSAAPGLAFRAWLEEHVILVLNVAGSRESRAPGIEGCTRDFLVEALET